MNPLHLQLRSLLAASGEADPSERAAQTRQLSIMEGCLWALMWGLGEAYISPYALALGAGDFVMAFIGTAPVLVTALAQIVGGGLPDRLGRRKPIILAGISVQAFMYLPLFALPLLLPVGGIPVLMLCVVLYYGSFGLATPSLMSLMGDVVDDDARGRYFANRTRIVLYFMVITMMLAGQITQSWKTAGFTMVGFGMAFGIAAMARFAGVQVIRRFYDAPLPKPEQENKISFLSFLRGGISPNFTWFTFAVALMSGSASISGPFFAVYMLRDLGWSYLQFSFNVLVALTAQSLFVRWWGAVGDRHGNRAVLRATSSLMPFLPLVWLTSTNYWFLCFAQVFAGSIWSGFNLAWSNFIYDSVPQARRAKALSYFSLTTGCFSAFGGMVIGASVARYAPSVLSVGGLHITFLSSLPFVFITSSLFRAIAAMFLFPQFKEVRDIEPISAARIIWRLGIGQPIFGQVGMFMPRLRSLLPARDRNRKV